MRENSKEKHGDKREKRCNILVIGGDQKDRFNYAIEMAQRLLCINEIDEKACGNCLNCTRVNSNTHPNMVFVEPSSQNENSHNDQDTYDALSLIKIDQIRRLIIENQKANFEAGVSIYIITHMHKLTKSAANALLKVMEETGKDKLFIGLSPSRMTVLPTIASRLICHFVKPKPGSLATSLEKRNQIMDISQTQPKKRLEFCQLFRGERDGLMQELSELTQVCHTLLKDREISPQLALRLLDALLSAEKNLEKNLNPRLVLEHLLFREWPFVCQ